MRNREPVQIVNVYIPVLVDFVALAYVIATAILITGILSGRI